MGQFRQTLHLLTAQLFQHPRESFSAIRRGMATIATACLSLHWHKSIQARSSCLQPGDLLVICTPKPLKSAQQEGQLMATTARSDPCRHPRSPAATMTGLSMPASRAFGIPGGMWKMFVVFIMSSS